MRRRGKIITLAMTIAIVGALALMVGIAWVLWASLVASEEEYAGGLAAALGASTERIVLDTRDMLAELDGLAVQRCSPEHLQAMRSAAISRPYIRGIGYWRATERICDVGFLPQGGLKPARADRIYDNGLVAWWPSPQTEWGGVQLFLMRYGDHDVAIDPRRLVDLGLAQDREAVLWVEGLRMAAVPWNADLPTPDTLPIGVSIDRAHDRLVSRYSRNRLLPIDVVAVEPLGNFWSRHEYLVAAGAAAALAIVAAWLHLIVKFSRRELTLASELRQALARGELKVHYQPVVELSSGRCMGAEALARWTRDGGEPVSPAVFIPAAEAAGMIQDLTVAVLRTAVRDIAPIVTEFPGISINVNLSPDDLKNDRIGRELISVLAASGLPTTAIKLEITERALVNNEISRSLIREFRSRGHQVAIDDFGTGYSSLSYLQSFELDVLKIDKSFVDAIGTGAATSQVIVHVIEMAKSLG
ncbi:MAG TPA: EAL domain-containing protein, partial [Rudaea sp.]|nr:EAL domain-containing protein [Rudaea sp.]